MFSKGTRVMESPCKNCKERKVNAEYDCHDGCARYKKWKTNKRIANKIESEQRSLQKAIDYRSKYYE